jgi:hypothetical protein
MTSASPGDWLHNQTPADVVIPMAENLGLDRMRRDVVLNAMLIKNSA